VTAAEVDAPPGTVASLLRAMRPKQWVKNLLVLAAPLAAGALTEPGVALATLVAVGAFCLASSAVYLFNDAVDMEADRRHPTKRHRPVAAGHLSQRLAVTVAAMLAVVSLGVAATTGLPLLALMASYLVLQVTYALVLKNQAVLDIAVVASGFLLRAVAGGVAAGLPISQWFLLVAGFGSLFIVTGKRYAELKMLGRGGETRRALVGYTESYLRFVWGVSTGVTIMSYSLWAFQEPTGDGVAWHALSIAPFVLGMMRYSVDIDAGRAGDPEDIIWHDRILQLLGVAWILLVGIGVSDV
jgi:decaprenyl-phosphate phosphoribosyltransferase